MRRGNIHTRMRPSSEILPGVQRIEGRMGDNRVCLYALRGEETLLVDSGLATTPVDGTLGDGDRLDLGGGAV
jgi:hypothetical protein